MEEFVEDLSPSDYQLLGAFRYQIRRFLHFSETAANVEGLEPQQHQMLLAIRALDGDAGPTVGTLAAHMLIRHHSTVGLIDRLEERGLVNRERGEDRRTVHIRLSPEGEETLKRLSSAHRDELRNLGPLLVVTLNQLLAPDGNSEKVTI